MNLREQNIVNLIRERILKKNLQATIILFGSHAKGNANGDSDWDILILLKGFNMSREVEKEYREELFEVELEVGEPVSTFVFSEKEWELKYSATPFYQNIKEHGILLT